MATTNLLKLLASVPPEQLVEGARIEVMRTDDQVVVVTLGPRTAADPLGFAWTICNEIA